MRCAWVVVALSGCVGGGGGSGFDEREPAVASFDTTLPLAMGPGDLMAGLLLQFVPYSGNFCTLTMRAVGVEVAGGVGLPYDPYYPVCVTGPVFDGQGHALVTADGIAVGAMTGAWAIFALGEGGRCSPTVLSDGTYVGCSSFDLAAVSPDGALAYRASIGGTPSMGLVSNDEDTVFALVYRPDYTWHLAGVDTSGAVAFDVPIAEPQDTPSLGNDGTVLVSVQTAEGPAVHVFAPDTGELVREVPLDKPSYSVLVAEDDDWLVVGRGKDGPNYTLDDTVTRMSPDGTVRWRWDGPALAPGLLDDRQRLWVAADGEMHVLDPQGAEQAVFAVWGTTAAGPPVLQNGLFGATYDGVGVVARLNDGSAAIAPTGWPRAGGSNRNDGRRPQP